MTGILHHMESARDRLASGINRILLMAQQQQQLQQQPL